MNGYCHKARKDCHERALSGPEWMLRALTVFPLYQMPRFKYRGIPSWNSKLGRPFRDTLEGQLSKDQLKRLNQALEVLGEILPKLR